MGRFVSQDPIGLAGGLNVYRFAPNAQAWVDPLGLAPNPNDGWDIVLGGSTGMSNLERHAQVELAKFQAGQEQIARERNQCNGGLVAALSPASAQKLARNTKCAHDFGVRSQVRQTHSVPAVNIGAATVYAGSASILLGPMTGTASGKTALTSGLVSAGSQKLSQGKINMCSLGMDMAAGEE